MTTGKGQANATGHVDSTTFSAWDDIISYFPARWRELVWQFKVMKGARRDKDLDATMHTLLMHLACGFSLKETVARARLVHSPLYSSSHVALRNRLIKFGPLFKSLCGEMFAGSGVESPDRHARLRLVDATDIHEDGPMGSVWRFHYSLLLPDLTCHFIRLQATSGEGTGENLTQFSMGEGDHLLANKGYSRATGVSHACKNGARVCIRLNYGSLKLFDRCGKPFRLVAKLRHSRMVAR